MVIPSDISNVRFISVINQTVYKSVTFWFWYIVMYVSMVKIIHFASHIEKERWNYTNLGKCGDLSISIIIYMNPEN